MTNFERITQSPETLVDYKLDDDGCEWCAYIHTKHCSGDEDICKQGMLYWMNEEVHDE